ncbi:hypothetical protein BS47DRAFT_1361416 [Hydnum rufescens UP504]|uniref:Uncharacterized protein n=1 Tax=Hydnum rufescens UP504 TaxID=1448309 RepID=A0A9P6AZR2_9AGAM|nr:hypothetical protein BS47DRAFT_1361416 [Hydnum rufescens UP504]
MNPTVQKDPAIHMNDAICVGVPKPPHETAVSPPTPVYQFKQNCMSPYKPPHQHEGPNMSTTCLLEWVCGTKRSHNQHHPSPNTPPPEPPSDKNPHTLPHTHSSGCGTKRLCNQHHPSPNAPSPEPSSNKNPCTHVLTSNQTPYDPPHDKPGMSLYRPHCPCERQNVVPHTRWSRLCNTHHLIPNAPPIVQEKQPHRLLLGAWLGPQGPQGLISS